MISEIESRDITPDTCDLCVPMIVLESMVDVLCVGDRKEHATAVLNFHQGPLAGWCGTQKPGVATFPGSASPPLRSSDTVQRWTVQRYQPRINFRGMIQVPASGFSRYVLDAAFLDAAGFRQAVGRVGVRVLA